MWKTGGGQAWFLTVYGLVVSRETLIGVPVIDDLHQSAEHDSEIQCQ
jgi:hypothetical protein